MEMDDVMEMKRAKPQAVRSLPVGVNIQWDAENRVYDWTFEGPNVDADGTIRIPGPGKTAIVFTLDATSAQDYQLLFVNLDAEDCATHQIEGISVDPATNSVTVMDRNTPEEPFSLSLVARMNDNIESGFVSSDPQVVNHPNEMPQGS
jgi:hypothetical protein